MGGGPLINALPCLNKTLQWNAGPFLRAHSFETKANRVDDKRGRGRREQRPMDSCERTRLGVGIKALQ